MCQFAAFLLIISPKIKHICILDKWLDKVSDKAM